MAFNRPRTTRAVAPQTQVVWNFRLCFLSCPLIFFGNKKLEVVLDGKSLQEFLVNAGVPARLHS